MRTLRKQYVSCAKSRILIIQVNVYRCIKKRKKWKSEVCFLINVTLDDIIGDEVVY